MAKLCGDKQIKVPKVLETRVCVGISLTIVDANRKQTETHIY